MSLTVGTAPFGQRPGGVFNFEVPRKQGVIWFEDSPRRIRARLGGETVVDSRHAKLLHEHAHLPIYYFPQDEVRMDLLVPTDRHTTCPYKGEASYWSVHAGGKVAENAVWSYPEPLADAPPLAGFMAFYWDKMDEWLEEDEPMIVHARDPYHRIDVLDTSRHVRVSVDGEPVADTTRARALFETGLPTRWYIPREDVRMELLLATGSRTGCAYKGYASYWSVGDEEDVVWSYPDPRPEVERIRDYLAFFNERVDIEVDGELQERPVTQWSKSRRPRAAAPHS
ncbi:MAG TPA: DUF427 domain-containing protein [Solirubrobacterales bacterium]|nr:DUF427 domain-containing protein [Solirubrobacterales bacterium]